MSYAILSVSGTTSILGRCHTERAAEDLLDRMNSLAIELGLGTRYRLVPLFDAAQPPIATSVPTPCGYRWRNGIGEHTCDREAGHEPGSHHCHCE